MMVPFNKTLEVDSEVSIGVEDITSALRESLDDAQVADHASAISRFVSDVHQCLRAVDDQMIDKLPEKHRKIFAEWLRDQAKRYTLEIQS